MEDKPVNDPAQGKIDWREHHAAQPYASKYDYEACVPAYRTAEAAVATHAGKPFEEIEDDLALGYSKHDASSALPWDEARPAVQSAWDKLGGVITPQDRDRGMRGGL